MRRAILILFVCLLFACEDGEDDDPTPPCAHTATLMGDSLTALPGWANLIQDEFLPGEIRIAAGLGFTMGTWHPGEFWYEREEFEEFPELALLFPLGCSSLFDPLDPLGAPDAIEVLHLVALTQGQGTAVAGDPHQSAA